MLLTGYTKQATSLSVGAGVGAWVTLFPGLPFETDLLPKTVMSREASFAQACTSISSDTSPVWVKLPDLPVPSVPFATLPIPAILSVGIYLRGAVTLKVAVLPCTTQDGGYAVIVGGKFIPGKLQNVFDDGIGAVSCSAQLTALLGT